MNSIVISGISAVVGAIFKYISNAQADKQKQYEMLIGKSKLDIESNELARKFNPNSYTRRFIAISFTITFLLIIYGYNDRITTIINEVSNGSYLYGLIDNGTKIVTTEVKGAILISSLIDFVAMILGFYFGTNTQNRN